MGRTKKNIIQTKDSYDFVFDECPPNWFSKRYYDSFKYRETEVEIDTDYILELDRAQAGCILTGYGVEFKTPFEDIPGHTEFYNQVVIDGQLSSTLLINNSAVMGLTGKDFPVVTEVMDFAAAGLVTYLHWSILNPSNLYPLQYPITNQDTRIQILLHAGNVEFGPLTFAGRVIGRYTS